MTAPRLLETMRAEDGRIALLDRHLARLTASAEQFRYSVDLGVVRARLAAAIVSCPDGVAGVRLTLGATGDVEVEVSSLEDRPFRTAMVDPEPFAGAGSPLCRHKTTSRAHYERRYESAQRLGADEAILVNLEGMVVEGTRTSVWVERDGHLLTPPLSAGGLPGVMRAHLLATLPNAAEAHLTPADLWAADAVSLSNALRGWMPVRLLRPESPAAGGG